MGYQMQLAKNMSKIEPRSFGLGLLIGCFMVILTYLSMSEPLVIPFTSVNCVSPRSSLVPSSPTVEDKGSLQQLENTGPEDDATQENYPIDDDVSELDQSSSSTKFEAPSEREVPNKNQQLGTENKTEEPSKEFDNGSIQQNPPPIDISSKNGDNKVVKQIGRENKIKNQLEKDENDRIQKSSPINNLMGGGDMKDPQVLGTRIEGVKPEMKPVCNLQEPISDRCEMEGNVRIHGKSSSVVFVNFQQMENSEDKGPWQIRPYARKFDSTIMEKVREVTVRLSNGLNEASCTVKNSIPAIVFAAGGYTGNVYHAFNDVLVPLFATARQFDSDVQLFISPMDYWFVDKYREIFKLLSRYEVIEFDKDDEFRCYPHVIVGLHSYKDMSIDPSRTPKGYSMIDFKRFLMRAYSLEKDTAIKLAENPGVRPRLLIISRGENRKFINIDEIAQTARMLGFEVVISDAKFETRVSEFAHIVNSCDVMMGVHGAGLTNEIFLPINGIMIQVVPWGGLEGISQYDYGEPAIGMGLRYLQYSIKEEESTLTELYPRDHPVFKDPMSFHEKGWNVMGEIFMVKQNVKLDMDRFSPVFIDALELLKQ